MFKRGFWAFGLAILAAACSPSSHEPQSKLVGKNPVIPAPEKNWFPTLNFSTARGWPKGAMPQAPAGFVVTKFAGGLDHPRWLYQLPDGDILVAESTTEPPPPKSIADRVAIWLQRNSDANGKSANRITLLRDTKGKGVADTRWTFLSGLHQPFGMLLLGDKFYVGDTDGLMRFTYKPGAVTIDSKGRKILALPQGGYNNHWTRNVFANADGTKLYVTVGSGSNVGEHGAANEFHRADILEVNPDGSGLRILASGLRNPNGLGYEPTTHALWTVVNERDMLGNDLTPDYLTHVVDGGFYGWPYSYWGRHVDTRVAPQRPDLVAKAITPDYSLGSHVAPLGLAFYDGTAFPASYRGGAFIGEHGSWNRKPFSGYKVVFVPFKNGEPSGDPQDFLTGFMPADQSGIAYGRPVGVIVAKDSSLLVADDVGNCIWRVAAK
ncbi:MAG TPA: sorbosone dehydrogenase family protein [Rhizomicrobium sp.]|nr:sorbosone dehydrogenase family protein [Rhizomicrobium sp.]